MSVKCGRCRGYHESVADVRACFNGQAVGVTQATKPASGKTLSESQVKYVHSLLGHLNAEYVGEQPIDSLDRYAAGRKLVDGLVAAREAKAHGRSYQLPEGVSQKAHRPDPEKGVRSYKPDARYPDVPAGHYAVPSLTGNNDLDFFRVDRPTEGQWAGRTFVKRVIGGHPNTRVHGSTARAALEAILSEGTDKARVRYGQEIGRCWHCNRHLTDEESRRLGIGPVCRAS